MAIYASNINIQITAEENNYRPNSLDLTPHDSINVGSDSGFEVFPGTGTAENPYLIEGYNITTTDDNGIYISGTTKYFTVRNCYVDAKWYGIRIDSVAEGTATVINNICDNSWYGIRLYSSRSSTVINNTCSNSWYGITLDYSGGSTVANNTCSNNNDYGICLSSSSCSTVANNTFTNCGLFIFEDTIDAYLSYTVENNWVNGKKLGFYTNLDSTTIAEPIYGQLILVNCINMTVRDQILNNATIGLSLFSCTSSVIINNTCNHNWGGIWLGYSGSSIIENNTCNHNNGYNNYGIYLYSSGSSTVANNTCDNNDWDGIRFTSSGSSTVANNTCNHNSYGIYLYNSDFCVVTYNLLQENEFYGVSLISHSDNNLIHHNTFVDNNLGGTSQALDDCTNNYWYDPEVKEGNYWSDWSGRGDYYIDGSAGTEDRYPLDEPAEYSTDENQLDFTFILLIVVVTLLLTRIISKKKKK